MICTKSHEVTREVSLVPYPLPRLPGLSSYSYSPPPFFIIDIEFVSTSYMSLTTTTTILVADTLALFTSRPLVCLFPPHPTTPSRLFDLSMLALCDPVDSIVLDIFNPIGIWLHDKLVWGGLCIIARTCHSSYRTKIPCRSADWLL
jgi:hypothetical protein